MLNRAIYRIPRGDFTPLRDELIELLDVGDLVHARHHARARARRRCSISLPPVEAFLERVSPPA